MVFAVPLRILLLICLIQFCTAVDETVNRKTLMNIVNNFVNQLGNGQFAVAVRVDKKNCLDPTYPGVTLTNEAINTINNNGVYESDNLIAAKPMKGPQTEHSEFRLMKYLQKILGKGDDCVVYFTVNSPCLMTCLGKYSISDSLKELEKYEGIKAFSFKVIWHHDKRNEVIAKLKEMAPALPYYECKKNTAECDPL